MKPADAMTVKELIEKLQEMPSDALVVALYDSGYGVVQIEKVNQYVRQDGRPAVELEGPY